MDEPCRHYSAPDKAVRSQIEAVKSYLRAERFTEVEDGPVLQQHVFEGYHVIAMTFQEQSRILRVSYQWLSDCPDVRAEIDRRELSDALKKQDEKSFVKITASGLFHGKLSSPPNRHQEVSRDGLPVG